ncbi:MAG: N-acetyltransferase [Flavobacteriaceae bacterium]|nr:N-acetyltransferase [Flavobacteriaceae bacterium]
MDQDLTIRMAEENDLASIVGIYNQAIRAKNACGDIHEFDVEDKRDWFKTYNGHAYPMYVAERDNNIVGYCTMSPYRAGKKGFNAVAEISYYLDYQFHNKGIGSALVKHAIADCPRIQKDILLAVLIDINHTSIRLLEKFKFEKWGSIPDVIEIDGKKCGHLIYGLKIKTP